MVKPAQHAEITSGNASSVPSDQFALSKRNQHFLLWVLAALFSLRLLAIFWLPFYDLTEARYAEIARKMLETGDWITPQFDYGVPFWGKPPLHTWLSALGMKIFGVGPFGARIFIFAAAISVLGLVFGWLRLHRGRDVALVVTVVLASSLMFFGAAAYVMTDMAMVLGTTLSMVGFYNCLTCPQSRVFWGRLFFVGLAIGLLSKGPVAMVLTMIPLGIWVVLGWRWRGLLSLPWVSGIIIMLVLTLPWYIAAEIKTPGFLNYFIIGEHYERFVVSGWQGDLYGSGHARPKGIIWLYWLGTFLPWTFFAIALLLRPKKLRHAASNDANGWYSYLALWAIAPPLLFTPAANLLPAYVLPGLPASAALFVSLWVDMRGAPSIAARRAFFVAIAAMLALYTALASIALISPATISSRSEKALVDAAWGAAPDAQITYWGERSFSAEFYTRGQVHFTDETAALEGMVDNGIQDAVAVPLAQEDAVAPYLADGFERIGPFGGRVLFVEISTAGDQS